MDSPSLDRTYGSAPKRRKLRKGTHSCWQCKRRKMRCIFDPDASICQECQRRGRECIGQEIDIFQPSSTLASDGLEAMRSQRVEHAPFQRASAIHAPVSNVFEYSTRDLDTGASTAGSLFSRPVADHVELSHYLYASLPPEEQINRILCSNSRPPVLPYEIMTTPYTAIDRTGFQSLRDLLKSVNERTHPVLIAKYMLLLACAIPHHLPFYQQHVNGESQSPKAIMERLAQLAISYVSTNDVFMSSLEGLECVVLESIYQSARGNMRRSWLSCRRAIGIAQLMGIHRPGRPALYEALNLTARRHPELLWFRMVHLDRLLSLLLGLPQCSRDCAMASEANMVDETSVGRFERINCALTCRVLERNESRSNSREEALAATEAIDADLQQAANALPANWWLVPTFSPNSSSSDQFWDMRRLVAQVLHFNLLIQLHLPYLLRASPLEPRYDYSRITCINAAREIVSRVVSLHGHHGLSHTCRIIDFITLMACMTLLLAHLDSRRWDESSLLKFQSHSDLAMIEQVQKIIEEVHRLGHDQLSAESANLIGRLLDLLRIDDGSEGVRSASRVSVAQDDLTSQANQAPDRAMDLKVHIPYFGIIQIGTGGISKLTQRPNSRDAHTSGATPAQTGRDRPSCVDQGPDQLSRHIRSASRLGTTTSASTDADAGHTVPSTTPSYACSTTPHGTISSSKTLYDGIDNDMSYFADISPMFAATGEEWALQGVDLNFFGTLMDAGDLWAHEMSQ